MKKTKQQINYMIFYRPKGSKCYTLAEVQLEEMQKLFHCSQTAGVMAGKLAELYTRQEFAVFECKELNQ